MRNMHSRQDMCNHPHEILTRLQPFKSSFGGGWGHGGWGDGVTKLMKLLRGTWGASHVHEIPQ